MDVAYRFTVGAPVGAPEFLGIVRRVSGASLAPKDQHVSRAQLSPLRIHPTLEHTESCYSCEHKQAFRCSFCSFDFHCLRFWASGALLKLEELSMGYTPSLRDGRVAELSPGHGMTFAVGH